jgi:hypothetical protein
LSDRWPHVPSVRRTRSPAEVLRQRL